MRGLPLLPLPLTRIFTYPHATTFGAFRFAPGPLFPPLLSPQSSAALPALILTFTLDHIHPLTHWNYCQKDKCSCQRLGLQLPSSVAYLPSNRTCHRGLVFALIYALYIPSPHPATPTYTHIHAHRNNLFPCPRPALQLLPAAPQLPRRLPRVPAGPAASDPFDPHLHTRMPCVPFPGAASPAPRSFLNASHVFLHAPGEDLVPAMQRVQGLPGEEHQQRRKQARGGHVC